MGHNQEGYKNPNAVDVEKGFNQPFTNLKYMQPSLNYIYHKSYNYLSMFSQSTVGIVV